MKPLHSLLQRTFSLARSAPASPASPWLEERVIAEWRQSLREATEATLRTYRFGLVGAAVVLLLSIAAYGYLAPQEDASISIANAALHIGLHL